MWQNARTVWSGDSIGGQSRWRDLNQKPRCEVSSQVSKTLHKTDFKTI